MSKSPFIGAVLALSLIGSVPATAEIRIGVAGPLTGPSAAFGDQLKNGAAQAADDINRAGGLLGEKVSIVLGDDVGDPKQAVSVANHFAGDGVRLVVGHFTSGSTIPASDIYADNGMLMVTPTATNPKITDRGLWNVFRTCGRDDQQASVAASWIASKFAGKKLAVVDDKTAFGRGLADEMRKRLKASGATIVVDDAVNVGEKDYSAVVSKLKGAGAEVIYWGGLYTEGGLILRQMQDADYHPIFVTSDGVASSDFASIGGPSVDGVLMTFAPDPRKWPEAASVVERFRNDRHFEPESFTLYAYAAVQVIAQAAERAKSADPKKVADALKSGSVFQTVLGPLTYDAKGDIQRPDYRMFRWSKGATGSFGYDVIE